MKATASSIAPPPSERFEPAEASSFVRSMLSAVCKRQEEPFEVALDPRKYWLVLLAREWNASSLAIRFRLRNPETGEEPPVFSFAFIDKKSVLQNLAEFEEFIRLHAASAAYAPDDPRRAQIQAALSWREPKRTSLRLLDAFAHFVDRLARAVGRSPEPQPVHDTSRGDELHSPSPPPP